MPDERLDVLAKLSNSEKVVHTNIEFYDIAGLVKGASKGEGLGNQFLSNIREVDAIVHVVRCFDDENIIHVDGSIDPAEIASLDEDEKELFLEELGLDSSGLDKLIKSSYKLLGLISFLTTGEMETRAWTIKRGSKAPTAAGKIHTDMERGFIKADTVSYKDLVDSGSVAAAREKGLIRSEGKDYIVEDGDVIVFKFNV